MKKFHIMAAGLCFALAALTGCARHSDRDGDMESDLVVLGDAAYPVDVEEEADETPPGEDFSAEAMARKIRAIEDSGKSEEQIIREIIDEDYAEVPSIVSETTAAHVEILPAETTEDVAAAHAEIEAIDAVEEVDEEDESLQDMAADYRKYLDIEAYDADAPAVEAPVVEDAVAETPELPAVVKEAVVAAPEPPPAPSAVETMIAEAPEEEEADFLLPPPLYVAPAPEPVVFTDVFEPGRSGAGEELSLEGFDDMDFEYFGNISESLLDAGS